MSKCKHDGCTNERYKRWHSGWDKWIISTECNTCTSLKKRYGITTGDRNKIMKEQGSKCAICYNEIEFKQGLGLNSWTATVDHDHKTNKVRGILCGSCNNVLGRVQDNTEILTNAIKYLERNTK